MFAFALIDTTEVDIRALVSHEINRAALHGSEPVNQSSWITSLIGNITDIVLIVEFILLLIALAILIRGMMKVNGRERLSKNFKGVRKAPEPHSVISSSDIERILNTLSAERALSVRKRVRVPEREEEAHSFAALKEFARANRTETDRLNFAISYASQASRLKDSRFKEAFALVTEGSDLDVIARQLNMGKGELQLILALKRSKIASLGRKTSEHLERS
ncbi:MAG: hypothetical protein ACP5US_03920 [Candidatus Kryptoniota bacterium]